MSDQKLRKQIIRLAHENPGPVRDALLPLLARTAAWDPLFVDVELDYLAEQITDMQNVLRKNDPKDLISRLGLLSRAVDKLKKRVQKEGL